MLMSDDLIRYDVLTQEALRGVIRKVLDEVAVAGLPGDHHFFITFDTTHPGVRLSPVMRERYPESMTIVIQHTFWNLETDANGFELDLTFNDVRERLRIPFMAIQAFFDPSVKFGLQFDLEALGDNDAEEHSVVDFVDESRQDHASKSSPAKADKGASDKSSSAVAKDKPQDAAKRGTVNGKEKEAEVVSLDAFRKKHN